MKSLYRQFIVATLTILLVSTLIGFMMANLFYLFVTKKKTDEQQVAIAHEIVHVLERIHPAHTDLNNYLQSVAMLGYQIYVTNEMGETFFFGEPFQEKILPDEAKRVITHKEIYHGIDHEMNRSFMNSHFANELRNTVGVPFTFQQKKHGLFIRQDIKLISSDFHTVLVGFILVIAIFNVVGMMWLARQMTRPISQLTEATKQLAKENYHYPLQTERKDEIGELLASFNHMKTKLYHNDLARKTFINNVSHDFQSPLMNIQGYAELLKSSVLTDEERDEYAEIIEKETKRLSNLTKQLMLLTSLDHDSYPMKYTDVRLDEQLKEVISKYRWRMEEADLEISYQLPTTIIHGDAELLGNVWDNLLTNAIKYNRPHGQIYITLLTEASQIQVIFTDSGIGIEAEHKPFLFEKFFRGDASRRTEGTGLGLSIVKQIIELHHGRIELTSQPGKGSTFTISLPIPTGEKGG